jgi:hypothetical protein
MGTLKMYSNAYDFKELDNYFQKINQWKDLTDEDKSEILLACVMHGGRTDFSRLIELTAQKLKERNLP